MSVDLFSPTKLGSLELANRIVMAPMTRARATADAVPTERMAVHYAQRAGAGLIISEATNVSRQGTGSVLTPGIYSREQIQAWRHVTERVHERNGTILLQLWHTGRVSHASMQENGQAPVSSSATHGKVNTFTAGGFERTTPPRALDLDEIPGVVAQFARAASNAIEAGFDGVQIHGANGYLLEQFMRDGVNVRSDEYGGSIENRCRFALEVTDAVIAEIGGDRSSIRISPFSATWDCHDSNPGPLYLHMIAELGNRPLAFLEIVEQQVQSAGVTSRTGESADFSAERARAAYPGDLVVNGGYDLERARAVVASGEAQAVSFAQLYMSNPDLAERFRRGAELNGPPNMATAYGGGDEGYTDYPSLRD